MKLIITINLIFNLLPFYQQNWTKKEKDAFVVSCIKNTNNSMENSIAKEYCLCMLEKVIETYPTPQEATKLTAKQAQIMAYECI